MPGAKELVEALYDAGATLGVVTDILDEYARLDIRMAGLESKFTIFACKDTSPIEEERLLAALSEAEKIIGKVDRSNVHCIDDRPERATAAKALGLQFIGVATGQTGYEKFRASIPPDCLVVNDLRDTKAIFRTITGREVMPSKKEKLKS